MESNISFACYNYQIENVKLLLNVNINYFIRDHKGQTPLHWACSKGFKDFVNVLITHVIKSNRNLKEYQHGSSICSRPIMFPQLQSCKD